jgi:hypothetical protein
MNNPRQKGRESMPPLPILPNRLILSLPDVQSPCPFAAATGAAPAGPAPGGTFTMSCPVLRSLLACAVMLAAVTLGAVAAYDQKDDEGFTPLFNGRDLTGWKTVVDPKKKDVKPEDIWSVKDGIIVCTGKANGYFHTEKSYKNYVLRYDWRYKRPAEKIDDEEKFTGNSGLLVCIQGEHKVWPKCIEVQGMNRDHGKLIGVSGAKATSKFDREALKKVRKPIGEWNTTEAVIQDGNIIAKVNGTEVDAGKADLTEGQIGFQSEGAEIHFRNIRIKEMK